jgi:hypothetical protein
MRSAAGFTPPAAVLPLFIFFWLFRDPKIEARVGKKINWRLLNIIESIENPPQGAYNASFAAH